VLIQFEEIGYLTCARTAEGFRRRGSHTALIAARIDEARRATELNQCRKPAMGSPSRAGKLRRCVNALEPAPLGPWRAASQTVPDGAAAILDDESRIIFDSIVRTRAPFATSA
jgi:hypothetical protein